MHRDKIQFPDTFLFQTDLAVRTSDLNYGGHLGHSQFFNLIHEARVQFLAQYGQSELSFYSGSLILSQTAAEFKAQAFYGDILTIQIGLGQFSKVSFEMLYKVVHAQTGKVVALFMTKMVCFEYQTQRLLALPELFLSLFKDPHVASK